MIDAKFCDAIKYFQMFDPSIEGVDRLEGSSNDQPTGLVIMKKKSASDDKHIFKVAMLVIFFLNNDIPHGCFPSDTGCHFRYHLYLGWID